MSHEQTVTIKHGNSWYNIPTMIGKPSSRGTRKRKVSQTEAKQHAIRNGTLGEKYHNVQSAVRSARMRSKSFD